MTVKHLHPLALIQMIWQNLINTLILTLIMIGLFKELDQWQYQAILGIIIFLAIITAVIKYWWFTYELDEQAITIHSGIIFRQQIHIPYNRIQTLQLKQWFYMKPFNVLAVSIETAGQSGSEAEGQLPVIAKRIVEQLQQRVTSHRNEQDTSTSSNKPNAIYHIDWADLNTYALTSLGIIPLLVGLGWLYNQLDDMIPQKWLDQVFSQASRLNLIFIISASIGILIFGMLISYLIIIQRYFHFQLEKRDDQLVTEKGFFQHNTITASLNRIQAIVIQQTIIRQWLKLASVQVILASSAADKEDQNNLVMMPVISQHHYDQIRPFIPWLPLSDPTYIRISQKAKWLLIRNAVALAAIPVVALAIFFRPWGWLGLLLLPIAVGLGLYAGHNMGVAVLSPQLLTVQDGHLFKRSTYLIPKRRVQAMTISQSVWMKRTHLAHLRLQLRHGDSSQQIEVRYLPVQVAQSLYEWYQS
ncbi:PH domain-containing protein [Secundilactobacillus mixtipabuli]|uniref:Membrane protein n=1 Tax=Secundilactobacillus mixtipabuli TaxID=1435342 RepID=A0A1Z5IB50_9LACO|nr:PH domain-containing protein [Secundilactobacillus mixtipabuli]GAW98974.1 membrane protein [Secundilactobacillus mixtipabuli]